MSGQPLSRSFVRMVGETGHGMNLLYRYIIIRSRGYRKSVWSVLVLNVNFEKVKVSYTKTQIKRETRNFR